MATQLLLLCPNDTAPKLETEQPVAKNEASKKEKSSHEPRNKQALELENFYERFDIKNGVCTAIL